MTNLDPRGMVGRIYVEDHLTLLHTKYIRDLTGRNYVEDHKTLRHTKYISSVLHGFRKEDFLKVFPHYSAYGSLRPLERSRFGPLGYG